MAVKIRLKRVGAKHTPFYRIVIMESARPRDGKVIDTIGRYNSLKENISLELDKDKANKWLSQGAIPTDVVTRLFSHAGIETKKTKNKATKNVKKTEKEQPKRKEAPKDS